MEERPSVSEPEQQLEPRTRVEIVAKYEELAGLATSLMEKFEEFVGPDRRGLRSIFAYEGARQFEQFFHRVSDIMTLNMQASKEAVDQMVQGAIDRAAKKIPPVTPLPEGEQPKFHVLTDAGK